MMYVSPTLALLRYRKSGQLSKPSNHCYNMLMWNHGEGERGG